MKKQKDFWEIVLDWRAIPPLFVVFTLVLNLLANGIYGLLTAEPQSQQGEALRAQSVIFLALGFIVVSVVAYLLFAVIQRLFQKSNEPVAISEGKNEAFKFPRRGVVFTLGGQVATLKYALENQKPEYIGVLCSQETEKEADTLAERFGFPSERVRKWSVTNAKDVRAVKAGAQALLGWLLDDVRLSSAEIVIDLTGGLKTMSVGAFLAAEEVGIDTQYVASKYDDQYQPITGTQDEILLTHALGRPAP